MKTNEWMKREKYVALHAQPFWFRVIKYIVIVSLFIALGLWKGWEASLLLLLSLAVLGTMLHFILRWKTKAWTQSWGPYKKMELPK